MRGNLEKLFAVITALITMSTVVALVIVDASWWLNPLILLFGFLVVMALTTGRDRNSG